MKEQLKNQLSEILNQIAISVKDNADFTFTQLPDIAKSYVTFGTFSIIFAIVILFSIAVLFTKLIIDHCKCVQVIESNDIVIAIIFFLVIGIPLYLKINELILILTAPKVWFLIQIKSLL